VQNLVFVIIEKFCTKIDETDTVDHKPGGGKTCKMGIADNIASVEELILSHENALRRRRSFKHKQ